MNEFEELNNKIEMFEMANLKQNKTGLPMIVWIDTPLDRKMKHNKPRLKFQTNTSTNVMNCIASMSIEDNPQILVGNKGKLKQKELQQLIDWIKLNKEELLAVWNDKLDQIDFANNNKKLND